MAIYKSATYIKGSRARPDSQVETGEFTSTIVIPAGTALVATTDLFYFGKLGENVDLLQVDLTCDSLDSTGTTTGFLGVVPATTAKVYATVLAVAGAAGSGTANATSVMAATALNGAAGIAKNHQRLAGGVAAAADAFNINPYPILSVVGDIVMGIAVIGTQVTTADRKITLRAKYQYAYPGNMPYGVGATATPTIVNSSVNYPFTGVIVNGAGIQYDYNGQAG